MANFSIINTTTIGGGAAQGACTTTYKTQISLNNSSTPTNPNYTASGSPRRGKLYDILVGTNGTPADNYMEWDVIRIVGGTAAASLGSVSSISSNFALDPSDNQGHVNIAGINSSVESLFTGLSQTFYVGVNQRASYRWVAAPGSEIVWPAATSGSSSNGVAGRVRSGGYTGTATMQWLWQEQ